MPKMNSTIATFAIASILAVSIASTVVKQPWTSNSAHAQSAEQAVQPRPRWAASATGRIEPKSGEVKVAAEVGGKIVDIPVEVNAAVRKGDLLVALDAGDVL